VQTVSPLVIAILLTAAAAADCLVATSAKPKRSDPKLL